MESEPITSEHAILTYLHTERLVKAKDIDAYNFTGLEEVAIRDIYDRISEAERRLASPGLIRAGYDLGTAVYDNEIAYFPGQRPILITSEHATSHYRSDEKWRLKRKVADLGTAGLGFVLSDELNAHFMTMRGRQHGDANFQKRHPFKDGMARVIGDNKIEQFISLHGMKAGKFSSFFDDRAYDVLLGVGTEPTKESVRTAERIEGVAAELGLRCATNEFFISVVEDDPLIPELDERGNVVKNSFHAPDQTTRAHAQYSTEASGRTISTVQIELSDLFRLMPKGIRRAQRTRRIGTFVGYELLRLALQD